MDYPGIEVTGVQVVTPNHAQNTLTTFWNQSDLDLSRGLDFTPRGSVFTRFTHLNHAPFVYNIRVNNRSNTTQMGTCRIFIGPKFDERNLPFSYRVQKDLMIEMDKFTVTRKCY